MRTKIAAYAAAAVLMGLAVMMLPLGLEAISPTSQLYPQSSTNVYPDSGYPGDQRDIYGLTSHPFNLTSSSLILVVGLIFALAAYIIVKKQVNPPPAFSYWYKPF